MKALRAWGERTGSSGEWAIFYVQLRTVIKPRIVLVQVLQTSSLHLCHEPLAVQYQHACNRERKTSLQCMSVKKESGNNDRIFAYMTFVLFIRTFQSYRSSQRLEAAVGMDQHLGITLNSLVKLLVCDLRIFNANLMTDDEAWLRLARDNEIS